MNSFASSPRRHSVRYKDRSSANLVTNRMQPTSTTALVESSSKTTFGSLIWIVVAGLIPIYRFVVASGLDWLPEAILIVLVISLVLGKVRHLPGASIWILSAVLIVIAGFVSGANSNALASVRTALALAILLASAPFVLRYYTLQTRVFLPRAAAAFISIQTLSSVAALAQAAGMTILGAVANSGRANGLAGHPNVLGLMCVISIALAITAYASATSRVKALLLLAGVINLGALIATGSLSSLLSLAAVLIVIVAVRRAGLRTLYWASAGFLAVGVLAFTAGFDPSLLVAPIDHRINVVTGESDGVASLGIRQQTYAFAWDYIRTDPLIGVGMDSTNQGTFNGVTVVHNYVLHAWYQGGLAFVLATAVITLLLFTRIRRAVVTGEKAAEAAIIAAVIVYALGSAFYDQQQYWLPILFAVAASYPRLGEMAKSSTKDRRPRPGDIKLSR